MVIPAGVEPEDALDRNENYKVVWQVLNALRSHDDRFDAMINKLEFNGSDTHKMEVIAIADTIAPRQLRTSGSERKAAQIRNSSSIGNPNISETEQLSIQFEIGAIERALYAQIVKKCGNRHHWEDWANDIAKIANTHIDRIRAVLENPANRKEQQAFAQFAAELRDDLNNAISDEEIIEMLAQHLITKPVFDALFSDYRFAEHNPMSRAMQGVLDLLQEQHLDKERKTLESFYQSVQLRASGIETAEGKQKIIVELYDKFFRNAFPRMTERLGIVYTPVEVVDFIIQSVEDVLQSEFSGSLQDENVHIIDPFTGTGTFITRLLQSGIIPTERLPEKYRSEIHANEIVLLAYYIAAINIEATYHDILQGNETDRSSDNLDYVPFNGICLTDTFQMYEKGDILNELLVDNSARRKRQKELDIQVIIGNPPYSAGQESANDNNANIDYPHLDGRIRETFAKHSTAALQNKLYDSYIRAIRWASDRIQEKGGKGVIGFVTNAGWIDANTTDGLRKCLAEDFSSLYIFHLRGNQRTSGERSRKEGGKIFGSGSRAPIAISILVRNPVAAEQGKIYFHDIGDYLTREQKLEKIQEYGSINGIIAQHGWQTIVPDEFNDWLNQRDPNFDNYISLGDKKDKDALVVFENYSLGIATNRDAWVYNFSARSLKQNMQNTITFYNSEVARFQTAYSIELENQETDIDGFIIADPTLISWTVNLKSDARKKKMSVFDESYLRTGLYRPFTKQNLYFDKQWIERTLQMPKIYPNTYNENHIISVTGRGATKAFSALITNEIPDLEMISKGQCFPMDLYEEIEADIEDEETASSAQLSSAQLSSAQLSSAQLSSAQLSSAQLSSAQLSSAQLSSAQLSSAQLSSAQLSSAQLSSAQLNYTHSQHRKPDHLPDGNGQQRFLGVDDRHLARPAPDWRCAMLPDVSLRNGGGSLMENRQNELFAGASLPENAQAAPKQKKLVRRSAITDDALAHFRQPYAAEDAEKISKEDIFYYIYGLLHSEEYRERYADNLSKQLPRIPRMKHYRDFAAFVKAGRDLAALHLNYETVPMYTAIGLTGSLKGLQITDQQIIGGNDEDFYVQKMKFVQKGDITRVIYNGKISVENIPEAAYEYVVNGKSALEWVMERQAVSIDRKSGISNNANDWARETMNNPRYPLELFLRVITVSLETQKIINGLPKLDIA